MDIDISVLRLMEREKDVPFDLLVRAIEEALMSAYDKTPNAVPGSRVELNRRSGHVRVLAPELDDEGNKIGEYDNTPEGFGRVAASTARQVIFQRLREAEDEQKYGQFSGVEGDIVSGVVQQGPDSRTVLVDLLKDQGLKLEERPFSVEEAYAAREAFVTSASQIVMPVVQIDGRPVGNGAPGLLASALRRDFHKYAESA